MQQLKTQRDTSLTSQDASNIPMEFVSIVSETARKAIVSLVNANSAKDDLNDDSCNTEEGNLRCPLGSCLNATQVRERFLFINFIHWEFKYTI